MRSELKKRLLEEMKFYFGKDRRRIEHAQKVLEYALKIMEREKSREVDELVVMAGAILHDIGIHACEKRYGSTAGHLQEKESPRIARYIMEKVELDEKIIDEVCQIIGSHHSPGRLNSSNFKIVYDADSLVNLREESYKDKEELESIIEKKFLTRSGRELAKEVYLFSSSKIRPYS